MNISILQSLIKRTSNGIATHERKLKAYLTCAIDPSCDYDSKAFLRYASIERSTIRNLVRIQKSLKAEMAKMIEDMRFEKFLMKMRNR